MDCSPDPNWMWSGGRPGELTGTEWERRLDAVFEVAQEEARNLGVDVMDAYPHLNGGVSTHDAYVGREVEQMAPTVVQQIQSSSNQVLKELLEVDGVWALMESFASLESAGVPRDWTARVVIALRNRDGAGILSRAKDVSESLRALHVSGDEPLTTTLREKYLLIVASSRAATSDLIHLMATELSAREIYTALVLIHDGWEGSAEELLQVARIL